jgi:lipid-A-disaccharide synthase
VAADSVEAEVRAASASWTFPHIIVREDAGKPDAFAAMDVALACSGTVTTELAAQGVAVVTGYRLGWITWAILRAFLFRSRYSTLVNVAAGREVIPEMIQTTFRADRLARAADRLLSDAAALEAQRAGQRAALAVMAGPGRPAAEIAAETILTLVRP